MNLFLNNICISSLRQDFTRFIWKTTKQKQFINTSYTRRTELCKKTNKNRNKQFYKLLVINNIMQVYISLNPYMTLLLLIYFLHHAFATYRPFHKTLPRSSAFVNWISVRFYETGCTCQDAIEYRPSFLAHFCST